MTRNCELDCGSKTGMQAGPAAMPGLVALVVQMKGLKKNERDMALGVCSVVISGSGAVGFLGFAS